MKPILTIIALLASTSLTVAEEHWPRFRGPNADGVAADHAGLPMSWTSSDNVKWVAEIPGWGWSNPIVWRDMVFLTTVVGDQENLTPSKGLYLGEGVREPAKGIHHWLVYCFDLNSGKQLWRREAHVGQPKVPRHPKSTYASETPTTDGERLYVLFGDLGLYCYDLDGKPLWSQPIEPKKTFLDYGAAASPVVHDGQVIVVYDNQEDSWIAAFDAKTGDQRWRTSRDETHSWATPFVWRNKVRTEIVVPGRKRNRGYSLDGKLLWEFDGRMSSLVIPSPFAAHGLCYIASGYVGDAHRPTFAVKPGASGDITPDGDFEDSEFIAWHQGTSSSYNPSQIVYGDYLYTLYDRGFLTCHDAKTGKEVYGKQRFSPRGSFTSSPWAYNGHLFFLSEDGLTYVVKAGAEFEIVGTSPLDELCLASPAVAGDKLLIRTASILYCLTKGARLDPALAARVQPRRKASAESGIWTAAAEGNRDEVKRLLAAGAAVNARQAGSGATPLNTSAVFGQTETAKLLIEKGADVSLANNDGNTALHIASFFAHQELVELLLQAGASVGAKNGRGETPSDLVSADWSPQLQGIYKSLGEAIGIELDLGRMKRTRPVIARLLRDHAAKQASEVPDDINSRTASIISEGTRMAAEMFSPKDAEGKLPTIIMSHGWGGTAQALRPDAVAFARAGFLVVTFDYRGWGNSDARLVAAGKPTKRDGKLIAEVVEVRGVVDPIDQTTDILNAIHWVQGEALCDKDRIGIWGSSFSGGHVVYVAARDPRVKAFVSQVGSMDARWAIQNPQLRQHVFQQGTARTRGQIGYPEPFAAFNNMRGQPVWEKLMRYAPIEDIGRCEKCAKLFIIAEHEELFDNKHHAIAAHERATGVKKLVAVKGIKHYGIYREKRQEAQQLAIDWFTEHLKKDQDG